MGRAFRLIAFGFLAAIGVWWVRLIVHSKTPAPEGHWREVTDQELSPSS